MTGLNCLLELTASHEFSRGFCDLFAHCGCWRADERERNLDVIDDRRSANSCPHPCHRHKPHSPRSHSTAGRAMASRALRPRRLLDVTVPRASQRIWRKPSVRGIHSEGVDSVFASQLDAIGVLCTSSGQKRGLENTSLYSLFVFTFFPRRLPSHPSQETE